jgi:hypothetical protein
MPERRQTDLVPGVTWRRCRAAQTVRAGAREDREGVRALLDGVRHLRHQVWVDERLSGGQAWWDEILAQLRGCDAMLIAISPALLESQASALERQYGSRVGKPLLPVIIRPVLAELLPPDLAPLQCIDYTQPGPNAAFELAGALYALPPTAPLPDPLPDPPPVPISYLSGLSDRVRAATLSLDDQLAVVARLRTAMEPPREREAALELLQVLRQRTDLYHTPALEIEKLLQGQTPPSSSPVDAPRRECQREPASDVPPDWYPDPSGRHELRWFDGDWTAWASDICSFLFGGIAMYFSSQVGSRWRAGNTTGAEKASKMALIWGIVGIAVGLIVFFAVIGSAESGY